MCLFLCPLLGTDICYRLIAAAVKRRRPRCEQGGIKARGNIRLRLLIAGASRRTDGQTGERDAFQKCTPAVLFFRLLWRKEGGKDTQSKQTGALPSRPLACHMLYIDNHWVSATVLLQGDKAGWHCYWNGCGIQVVGNLPVFDSYEL